MNIQPYRRFQTRRERAGKYIPWLERRAHCIAYALKAKRRYWAEQRILYGYGKGKRLRSIAG